MDMNRTYSTHDKGVHMNILLKTTRKLLMLLSLTVFIFFHHPLHAGEVFFPDYDAAALTVTQVNMDAKNAMIESPRGETALVFEGDLVGKELFSISAIREFAVELKSPPDNSGRKRKACIPVIPLMTSIPAFR